MTVEIVFIVQNEKFYHCSNIWSSSRCQTIYSIVARAVSLEQLQLLVCNTDVNN